MAKRTLSVVPDNMKPFLRITALLSTKQLAEVLGISYRSMLNLRSRHPEELPPSITIGRVLRYRACDVDAWIMAKPVNKGA